MEFLRIETQKLHTAITRSSLVKISGRTTQKFFDVQLPNFQFNGTLVRQSSGVLFYRTRKELPANGWEWGGCSADVTYGMR